ncbi:MAG: restriction endonuclease subunit S [gamma proteobacterium symbiont of Bathyaustriella thionipta]|nr:restriction endonuclease subunit S [gamma proteobacterium symbiont of Bathyaustriella thionipta]
MSWPVKKIGDICDVIPGFAFKSKDLGDNGIPVIKIGNITDNNSVDITSAQRLPEDLLVDKHSKFRLRNRDILLAMTGATAGKVGRIRCLDEQVMLLNQRVAKLSPRDVNPDFFWFIISTDRYRTIFYGLGGGAAQPNMSGSQIESIEIPCPPLRTQAHIASVLSVYDNLIENNRRRIQLLEQAARLLYKEWFVHLRFPGHEHVKIKDGVPEEWEKKTAFEVMEVLSGGTPKTTIPAYWDGDIPFFTPKDAVDYAYVSETEKTITEEGLKNCNSKLYPKDTVFITARGTVGKINLAQTNMAMNQSCYALIAKAPLNQHFLYFALKEGVDQFRSRAVGAVFDAIIRDTFKLIPFVVPDKMVVGMFGEHVSPILNQIDILSKETRQLAKARDLLLPRLMNGEVTT